MRSRFKKILKEQFFDTYAENLEHLKLNKLFKIEGKRTEGYVCPICNKIFAKDAIIADCIDQLTLEHVPPGKLGGSIKLLTCKLCNNEQGSKLEKHLNEKLLTEDFFSGIPNSGRPARFLTNENLNIGGKIIKSEKGFNMKAIESISHLEDYQRLFKRGDVNLKRIKVTIYGQYKKRRPAIALFRIGYLWLYSEFGFASLINSNMHVIRQQILKPDDEILNSIGTLKGDFPDEYEGVNIITKPMELRSFAVAFKTKTEHKERKHLVLLPGPTDPGLKIYDNLKKLSKKDGRINFELTPLNLDGVLTDSNRAYEYHKIWNSVIDKHNG